MSDMYDVSVLGEIAVNLFYGWGYNFYRKENQLRADDQLIRSKVRWLLAGAKTAIRNQKSAFARKHLPLPTREKPTPDPEAIARGAVLDELLADLDRIDTMIQAAPVPENDRMTQRYRNEAETLRRLHDFDKIMVGAAQVINSSLHGKTYDWILEHVATVREGVVMIDGIIEDRQRLLLA